MGDKQSQKEREGDKFVFQPFLAAGYVFKPHFVLLADQIVNQKASCFLYLFPKERLVLEKIVVKVSESNNFSKTRRV